MIGYRNALYWAAAICGVAVAGMFDVIDQASTTTLVIALAVAARMAVTGRGSCAIRLKA